MALNSELTVCATPHTSYDAALMSDIEAILGNTYTIISMVEVEPPKERGQLVTICNKDYIANYLH